jgi:peptidoglycan/LPS O-acetylase OafA/YrhL
LRQFARFMQRRIGRLLPLHLATLLGVALLFYLISALNLPTNADLRVKRECLLLGAVLLHAVIECGGAVPNFVSWSISAEMVMYAIFPLLLYLCRRLGLLRYLLWFALLVLVSKDSIGSGIWAENQQFDRAVPAFLFGLAVRLDWKSLSLLPMPSFAPIILALSLVAGSLLIWPDWILLTIAYGIAISALIADGRCRPSAITRRFAPLGQLTYSIYMLHLVVVLIIPNALGDKLLKLEPVPLSLLTLASYGVIIFASLISYKFFETPARRYIDGLHLVPLEPSQEVNNRV